MYLLFKETSDRFIDWSITIRQIWLILVRHTFTETCKIKNFKLGELGLPHQAMAQMTFLFIHSVWYLL
jgi:hypothetical protein